MFSGCVYLCKSSSKIQIPIIQFIQFIPLSMEDCEHVALLLNACLSLLNITYVQSKWWTGFSQTHLSESLSDYMTHTLPHKTSLILSQPHAVITQQELQIWESVQICLSCFPSINLSALLCSNLSDFLNMAREGVKRKSQDWTLQQSYPSPAKRPNSPYGIYSFCGSEGLCIHTPFLDSVRLEWK